MAKRKVLHWWQKLRSNVIKFHLFIDNNQRGGRVLALNCEVFIEWTLANISSPQWGQIIRAASYKSVEQEYVLPSITADSHSHWTQHGPVITSYGQMKVINCLIDTKLTLCEGIKQQVFVWFFWSSATFVKSIRIIPSREIACDLCWDGWETGQGKSWELSTCSV